MRTAEQVRLFSHFKLYAMHKTIACLLFATLLVGCTESPATDPPADIEPIMTDVTPTTTSYLGKQSIIYTSAKDTDLRLE